MTVTKLAIFLAVGCPHVFAQQAAVSIEETELFRQAIERFRGASRVTIADDDDSSFNRWDAPESKLETGVILEWNAEKLFLVRPNDSRERSISSPRVLRIEPVWENPLAEKLHELYSKQRWSEAIAIGPKVLGSKSEYPSTPRWQQKMLLAELVECRTSLGNWEKGAVLFHSLALAKESLPPLLATVIPIPWTDSSVAIGDRKKLHELSEGWIRDSNELIKLMGAAWLLDSDQQKEAIATLDTLARQSKSTLVSKYAEAQLWRTTPPVELATKRVNRCYAVRDSLLLPLQAGPTMLLAERFSKANEKELALSEWMRVAMMHSEQYRLASHAAKQAAAVLRERSQSAEADALEIPYRKLQP
ncbi:MAG: hypothetical protein ACK56W_08435 [Pirellula sp.]|nr:hypothetical protein [Pirellula sp.]